MNDLIIKYLNEMLQTKKSIYLLVVDMVKSIDDL